MTTNVAPATVRGEKKFVLNIYTVGDDGTQKRQRKFFDTRREAENEERETAKQSTNAGVVVGALSSKERTDVNIAIHDAKELGMSLREIVEAYKKLMSKNAVTSKKTLSEVIAETIAFKRKKGADERYVGPLKYFLERFAKGRLPAEGDLNPRWIGDQNKTPIAAITPADIEAWLGDLKGDDGGQPAPSTVNGVINKLSAMFALAFFPFEYIPSNPMDKVMRLPDKGKTPLIYTPQQISDLLWVCRQTDKAFLPYMVLGMFAGVRPEELEKLKWSHIDLKGGELSIDETVAKMGERRYPKFEPLLGPWLAECDKTSPHIVSFVHEEATRLLTCKPNDAKGIQAMIGQKIKYHREMLCERAGIKWLPDGMRKTCASQLNAKYRNLDTVAALLGNSVKTLRRYYIAPVRDVDRDAYQALTPTNVPNLPIHLPKGGKGIKRPGQLINLPENVIALTQRAA